MIDYGEFVSFPLIKKLVCSLLSYRTSGSLTLKSKSMVQYS